MVDDLPPVRAHDVRVFDLVQTEHETSDECPAAWQSTAALPSRVAFRGTTVFLRPLRISKLVVSKEMLLEFKQVRAPARAGEGQL